MSAARPRRCMRAHRHPGRRRRGAARASVLAAAAVLGLLWHDPAGWRQGEGDTAAIDAAIQARLAARAAKDWAEADRIRAELTAQGIVLEDGAGNTSWRRA